MRIPDFPNRSWLPDQLKGWAVIWMILIHSVELFLRPDLATNPLAGFAYFMGAVPAAPVFMLLMGYFTPITGQSFKRTLYRGGKLLVWGLLLNIGLNFSLILRSLTGDLEVNIWQYLFGVDILIFAGFALMVVALVNLLRPRWYVWFVIALMLSLTAFLNGSGVEPQTPNPIPWTEYLIGLSHRHTPWSYFPLIPWLAWVFTGIGLAQLFRERPGLLKPGRHHLPVAAVALVIFAIGLIPALKITQNLDQYYNHSTGFFLWALAFILLLAYGVNLTRKWEHQAPFRLIGLLGVRVTNAYVIQWLIIGNLGTWLYQSLTLAQTFGLFLLILFLTTYLTIFYSNLRHS